jgi:hypothetical protein
MIRVLSNLPDGGQIVRLPLSDPERSCTLIAGDQFEPPVRLRNVVAFREQCLAEATEEFHQRRQQMLDAGVSLLDEGDLASRRFEQLEQLAESIELLRDWVEDARDELEVVLSNDEGEEYRQSRFSEVAQRSMQLGIEAITID